MEKFFVIVMCAAILAIGFDVQARRQCRITYVESNRTIEEINAICK